MIGFLSSLPHGGMGCLNLDNDRAYITVPIKNTEGFCDSVTAIRSNSAIHASFFHTRMDEIKDL